MLRLLALAALATAGLAAGLAIAETDPPTTQTFATQTVVTLGLTQTVTVPTVTETVTVTAPTTTGPPPPPPPPSLYPQLLYGADSPWNTPIPASPALAPNSAAASSLMAGIASGAVVGVKKWSWPIYKADASTPKLNVRSSTGWGGIHGWSGVPIPASALASPDADGHMAVLDESTGCQYGFYHAAKDANGNWSAGMLDAMPFMNLGSGWMPAGFSNTGSGDALGGILRSEDFASGPPYTIAHALSFSYPYARTGLPVLPATQNDNGSSSLAGATPNGSHFQLEPGFDTSGLNAVDNAIAEALKRYGMYLMDGSGNLSLYADERGVFPFSGTYYYPNPEIFRHMRLLALGPAWDTSQNHPDYTGCMSWN